MGCGPQREQIESEMLLLRLTRTQIQEERAAILKELERITGQKVIRAKIPDYLSHSKQEDKNDNELKEINNLSYTKDFQIMVNKGDTIYLEKRPDNIKDFFE